MCIWKHISNLLQPRFCSLASTLLILNMKRFSSHSLLERYVHTYKCIYRHSRYKATHLHLIFNTVVNIHLISMFWVFTLSDFNAIFINKQIISKKYCFSLELLKGAEILSVKTGSTEYFLRKLWQKKWILNGYMDKIDTVDPLQKCQGQQSSQWGKPSMLFLWELK